MGKALPHDFDLLSYFSRAAQRSKEPGPQACSTTFDQVLAGAEQLLIYATEAGIAVEAEVSARILTAKHDARVWDSPEVDKLLGAIASLSAKVRPVTAQSLASCRTIARVEIRKYTRRALALVILILPLSILSFFTSGLTSSLTSEIDTANALVVALHTQLYPLPAASGSPQLVAANVAAPPTSMGELQQFAATTRSIKDHTTLLRRFVLDSVRLSANSDPRYYELENDLGNSLGAAQEETSRMTGVYQDVRRDARSVQDMVTFWYGAISTLVLPIFYASLGVCAYLLRLFEKELNSGSFSNRYDISARFCVAVIGGFIVGLFTNFNVTGASLSPLALAFLVGYAADVFFSFLEGLLANFKKPA